jgi:DNA replication and repair protein RecF
MHLKSLRLVDFRCYESLDLAFDPGINYVHGSNGMGKTSLVEAVCLLSTMRSFRGAKNAELIRWGAGAGARIEGTLVHGQITTEISLAVAPGSKVARINGKACRLLSEFFGRFPVVAFSPSDVEIIRGGPEERRAWADRLSTIVDPTHADRSSRYHRALIQKNRLLKEFVQGRRALGEEFHVWNEQLLELGAQITHSRWLACQEFEPVVTQYYQRISGGLAEVRIRYESTAQGQQETGQEGVPSVDSISRFLKEKQEDMLPKECLVGSSLVGPHRDDIHLSLQDKSLKNFGSQGEIRTAAMAMRLSEGDVLARVQQAPPVLVIDDLSSELDAHRRGFLVDYLNATPSQIFLTTTEEHGFGRKYLVNDGKVTAYGQ